MGTTCGGHVPVIQGEDDVDEQKGEGDFAIETEPYKARWHKHLSFVFLRTLGGSDRILPPQSFLLGWQPLSTTREKNNEESKRVQRLARSEQKQCYFNARKVMRSLPDYSDASYVEGFCVTPDGLVFEHGWIIKDGKVVDPTIVGDAIYFPGLEFVGREQSRAFLQTEWGRRFHGRPFYEAFGVGGCESPSFMQASKQAKLYLLPK